jgi:hypothetical protein
MGDALGRHPEPVRLVDRFEQALGVPAGRLDLKNQTLDFGHGLESHEGDWTGSMISLIAIMIQMARQDKASSNREGVPGGPAPRWIAA